MAAMLLSPSQLGMPRPTRGLNDAAVLCPSPQLRPRAKGRTAAVGFGRTRSKQHGSQRLFLDSADTREWEKWAPTGTLYGFTTNPLILDRDRVPCTIESCKQLALTARKLGVQELQCQAWGGSADALEVSALSLLELDPFFITVKLPCTTAGLTAAAAVLKTDPLASITITGVYKIRQALMAQAVGANYVAPYLGRIADIVKASFGAEDIPGYSPEEADQERGKIAMESAIDAVAAMQTAVTNSGSDMRVLVASIRSASDMSALAARGCNTFTFSPSVMQELCCVQETEAAAADFEAAAQRSQHSPSSR